MELNKIHCGDSFDLMQQLEQESIDFCMTSPPYWGLRDYGVEGQLGLEEHPNQYIKKLVTGLNIFKKKLKKTGSLYLNIGDTYFGGGQGGGNYGGKEVCPENQYGHIKVKEKSNWLQPKQLMLMPSRIAIALQEDGWILRNDIIWFKPNPMPSSVKDRLNTTFEHLFHFVKSKKYYYDLDSIREAHQEQSIERATRRDLTQNTQYRIQSNRDGEHGRVHPSGKNPGDVIKQPYSVQPRDKDIVEYRNLPEIKEFAFYINEMRKAKGLTIEEIEERFGNQAPHHWFNAESFPSKEDYLKLKEMLGLADFYDKQMTEIFNKPAEKINNPNGKNPGDFFQITTQPFPEAHFAVYPVALCEKPIKSSVPNEVCVECGMPRLPITDSEFHKTTDAQPSKIGDANRNPAERTDVPANRGHSTHKTIGWTKCNCNKGFTGAIVLDPFTGAGTTWTALKKYKPKAKFIGFELKKEYIDMAYLRVGKRLDSGPLLKHLK